MIGTERMESRRVDNQARGRSGRQGDEGVSTFYVSLEDDLMRIFGSESMNNILEKLGLKDGESINHPWINKALERAQQKVEARNFDIRKTLLKFDNVLNDQRQVIFTQRNNIIKDKKDDNTFILDFLDEILSSLLKDKDQYLQNPKNNQFIARFKSIVGKSFSNEKINEILKFSNKDFENMMKEKFDEQKKYRSKLIGINENLDLEKKIFLQIIDQNWKNHIQYLEQLRQVIGLRSYGNRDPLIEYKKEAYELFEILLNKIKVDLIKILFNLLVIERPSAIEEKDLKKNKINKNLEGKKIGRNEKCFCGSGKKYKHCCGSL